MKNPANYWNYLITATEHGGPFNTVAKTAPKERRDRNFWKHDVGYGKIGKQAYWKYNKYDEQLLKDIQGSWHWGDFLPRVFFTAKKYLAPRYREKKLSSLLKRMGKRKYGSYGVGGKKKRYRPGPSYQVPASMLDTSHERFKSYRLKKRVLGKTFKRRPKRLTAYQLVNAMYPKIHWTMNSPGVKQLSSGVGLQMTSSDLGGYLQILTRGDLQMMYRKLFIDAQKNVQEGFNNTSTQNSAYNENNATWLPSLQIEKYEREYTIQNCMTHTVYVELWEWLAIDDVQEDVVNNWDKDLSELTTTAVQGLYGLEQLPKNTVAPTTEKQYANTDPGRRPSRKLRGKTFENFKLLKKTKYRMEAGSHQKHSVWIKPQAVSQYALFGEDEEGHKMMKGTTVLVQAFLIGERCYDDTDGDQKLSYAAGKITFQFKDFTRVRMRPRIISNYRFETNAFENIDLAFDSSAAVPVAAIPAIQFRYADTPMEAKSGVNQDATGQDGNQGVNINGEMEVGETDVPVP